MAKTKAVETTEKDSTYFLKLVVYVLLGTLWIKFSAPLDIAGVAINGIPLGLFIGLLFARHDHFQIDRKIEYAVLILVAVITYYLPAGILL